MTLFDILPPDLVQIFESIYGGLVHGETISTVVARLTSVMRPSLIFDSNTNWNCFEHFSLYNFIQFEWENIKSPMWEGPVVMIKIYTRRSRFKLDLIKSDHFPFRQINFKLIQTQIPNSYGHIHVGCATLPPKEYIITNLSLLS